MPNISEADGSVIVEITGDDTGLRNTLNDVNNAVRNTAQQASQTAQQAVQSANTAAQAASQASSALGDVGSAAGSAAQSVNSASAAFDAAQSAAQSAADSVSSVSSGFSQVNSAASGSSSAFNSAANGAASFSSALGSAENSASSASSGMQSAADSASDCSAALGGVSSSAGAASSAMDGLGDSSQSAADGVRGFSDGVENVGENSSNLDGVLQNLGNTLKTVFSIALIKEFLGYVEQVGSQFEYTLDKVSTIADTTVKSVGEISDGILELSSETGVSGAELNETMYQAISAGVETANALDMVETAVKAAKAGFTDTTTAVDGLTTVLNSFKDAQLEANDVANKFLITQNLGKTSFGELASAIGNVAPTASAAGVSIEELLSATASLTANGIQTSQAMTGVKSALSNIITPSLNAAKMAEKLGIEFNAAALKSKGLAAFMDDLASATDGDTEKMAMLFGSVEALNSMLVLTSESGSELFNKAMSEMETNTTAFDDAYATMSDNLQSNLDVMKVNAENFGIDLYNIFSGDFQNAIQTVSEYIGRLREAMTTGGFSGLAGELFQIAFDAIEQLGQGIADALPILVPAALDAVITISDTIIDNIDKVLDTAEDIISGLADALVDPKTLDYFTEKAPGVVIRLTDKLIANIPEVERFCTQLCDRIAEGLVNYDWAESARKTEQNMIDAFFTNDVLVGDVARLLGVDEEQARAALDKFKGDWTKAVDMISVEAEIAQNKFQGYYNTGHQSDEWQDIIGTDSKTDKVELDKKAQKNIADGYAENARNAAGVITQANAEVSKSTAETAGTLSDSSEEITESTGKISDEFKAWYTELETLKAHGDIDDDEFKKRLSDKLNSSAEYLGSAYNSYWYKIKSTNANAAKQAGETVSDDFRKWYSDQERLLSLGVENGGISEETFYKNLAEKIDNNEYKNSPAYNSYRTKLNSYQDKQTKEAERLAKEASADFKKWYDSQTLLLNMGVENGGISEDEYFSRLKTALDNIPDSKINPAYSQYWKALSAFNDRQKKQAEKDQAELQKQQSAVSDDFKKWYGEQNYLLAKGVENGGISKEQYIENLRDMLDSSDEFDKVQYKSFWKEITTADEKAAQENQKAFDNIAKQRLKNLKNEAKDELSQLKSDISDLQNEYKENLNTLIKERDSFKSKLSENILSTTEESVTDKRTGQVTKKKTDTVADIQKKIESRKKLGTALQSLVKKGIPKGLLQELAGLDPDDALRFAEQLDKLDDTKWQNIVSSYNEYEEINNKIAEDIYSPEIKALNEQFANDLNTLLDGVSGSAAEKGAEMIRSFVSGIDTGSDDAIQQIRDFCDDVTAEMKTAVDGAGLIDGGLMLGEDYAQAIADGFADNSGVIEDAFNAVWGELLDEKFPGISAAVETRTAGLSQGITTRAVASQAPISGFEQTEVNVPSVTLGNVQLVMKDGRILAEVVNKENLTYQIQGGRI